MARIRPAGASPTMEQEGQPTSASLSNGGAEVPEDQTDFTGMKFGEFQILRRLGQGGMGQVYLAEQLSLKRHVALKIMRRDLASNHTALKRFQLEAEAVARVTHANIVQVYSVGVVDGVHFMALEYVEGKNLREYLAKKGPPEVLLALSIMRQVAAALQRAAELGIVHRDIKPENILLTRKGEVKVADFGLSRIFGADQAVNLTATGVSMGTPLYMSPEQVQGKEVDPRTDIYSFGVTCYHMLSGQPPYRGQSAIEVALQHVQKEAEPLQTIRPDLPVELCNVIRKMMAKDPNQRYQTARELLKDLMRVREGLAGGQTQGLLIGSGPVATVPVSEISLVPLPTTSRPRSHWLLYTAMTLSVVLALVLGIVLRVRHERALASVAPPPRETPSTEPPPKVPNTREAALREAVRRPVDANNGDEYRRHLEHAVQLANLYLEQRRLTEASAYFKELREQPAGPTTPSDRALSEIGDAIVLAFQSQPKASNEKFLVLERNRPALDKLPPAESGRAFPWRQVLQRFPEYFLLHRSHLRPMVVEALNHNAANLGEPLPEPLERLRRLPTPGTKVGG